MRNVELRIGRVPRWCATAGNSSGKIGYFGKNGCPNYRLYVSNVFCEQRGRRSIQFCTNISFTVVGTRRAVFVVINKRNRLYQYLCDKQTFP